MQKPINGRKTIKKKERVDNCGRYKLIYRIIPLLAILSWFFFLESSVFVGRAQPFDRSLLRGFRAGDKEMGKCRKWLGSLEHFTLFTFFVVIWEVFRTSLIRRLHDCIDDPPSSGRRRAGGWLHRMLLAVLGAQLPPMHLQISSISFLLTLRRRSADLVENGAQSIGARSEGWRRRSCCTFSVGHWNENSFQKSRLRFVSSRLYRFRQP